MRKECKRIIKKLLNNNKYKHVIYIVYIIFM